MNRITLLVCVALIGCAYQPVPTAPTVTPPPVPLPDAPPIPPQTAPPLAIGLSVGGQMRGRPSYFAAHPVTHALPDSATYTWVFGDGDSTTTTEPKTEHVYTRTGVYEASVTMETADAQTASASTKFQVLSSPPPLPPPDPPPCTKTLTLSPPILPNGTVGSNYSRTVSATGGTGPYRFLLSDGDLPNGLLLSSTGTISGTPTTADAFTFIIGAFDRDGCEGRRSYTVTIADKPGVMTATMSCTATSTTLNTASCNMTGTYNGAPVPSAKVTGVDWDWGDGDTETTAKPAQTHLYVHAGAYTVIGVMTADTANGPKTATASKTVTVPKPPPED